MLADIFTHGDEDFWFLVRNLPHLEMELFLMFLVDGLLGAWLWPKYLRWHHNHDRMVHPHETTSALIMGLSDALQRIEALEARAAHTWEADE